MGFNNLEIILILETGLFCWIEQQVRKGHSTFNEVNVAIAKVNSIFKEQIASQVSSFYVKTKQHL